MTFLKNYLFSKISIMLILGMMGTSVIGQEKFNNRAQSDKTVVIYLMGLAGTGKYTIAKKIAKYGYKVVDNHLINNPIFSLLGPKDIRKTVEGTTATERIASIRNVIFQFMKDDYQSSYILTNQLLDNGYHRGIYNSVLDTAVKRNSIFIPVKLVVSPQERARRIVNAERGKRFKITDPREVNIARKSLNVSHENLLELNVTNLSAEEAAETIMSYVRRIKNTR